MYKLPPVMRGRSGMFSQELVSRLRSQFDLLDRDKSGSLSIVELQKLWAMLFPQMTEGEVAMETQRIWRDLDENGDNAISFEELLGYLDPFCEDDIGELLQGPRYHEPPNCRAWVWAMVEQQASQDYPIRWLSIVSLAVSMTTQIAILVSIAVMVVESLPSMQSDDGQKAGNRVTFATEAACIGVFTLELLVRVASCPHPKRLLLSGWTAIDILAILPFYLGLAGVLESTSSAKSLVVLRVFRLARLVRVLRVLKLGRNSEGIQIMVVALQRSRMALTWLILLLAMAMLLFGSLMYHVEKE
eukprot:Sspe_Gene.118126::Locus_110891_Transcript_1_1_Confidence_1.000_Length_1055::g.118126::m.118126/K04899/KCNF1; potassium voltage-gated channel subfamily F member 1